MVIYIYIVDLPVQKMVIFHSYVNVYQRVMVRPGLLSFFFLLHMHEQVYHANMCELINISFTKV